MMRGCASTIGLIFLVVLGLAMFGSSGQQSSTTSAARPPTLDLAKPVYLAKDTVECGIINVTGTYMDGQQAGGEAEGHRAVANLFVHPRDGCVRAFSRKRVHVFDATVSGDKLVTVECITEFGNRCYVRPQDLEN
jgi:hypothetical protein